MAVGCSSEVMAARCAAMLSARRSAGSPSGWSVGLPVPRLAAHWPDRGRATGATIKDLMRRLGHASPAASYRYLHAVDGGNAEIASALSELAAYGDAAKLPQSIIVKH
jgi:hypothetical protein